MEKQVKLMLKDAKDLIQNKKFADALQKCQDVLAKDPDNYVALVFAGRCSFEVGSSKETEMFYKKATQVDSKNVLAWQGLAQYYDRLLCFSGDALLCYETLLQLMPGNDSKRLELQLKVAKCLGLTGNFEQSITEFQNLTRFKDSSVDPPLLDSAIVLALRGAKLSRTDGVEMVCSAFERLIAAALQRQNQTDTEEIERQTADDLSLQTLHYVEFLLMNSRPNDAADVCLSHCDAVPSLLLQLAFIVLSSYIENGSLQCFVNDDSSAEDFLSEVIDKCSVGSDELNENSSPEETLIIALEDIIVNTSCSDAIEKLEDCEVQDSGLNACQDALLGEAYLRTKDFWTAEKHLAKAKQTIHFADCRRLRRLLAEALQGQNTAESVAQSIDLYCDLLASDVDEKSNNAILENLFYAYLQRSDLSASQTLLDEKLCSSKTFGEGRLLCAQGCLLMHKRKLEDALAKLTESLTNPEFNPIAHYFIGQIYWMQDDPKRAIAAFLQHAKLDSSHSQTFFYLGQCYRALSKVENLAQTLEKSMRCFSRASQLNPHSLEISKELSDVYRALGLHEQNLALLLAIKEKYSPKRAKWAWVQLGVEFLATNQADQAVLTLQQVLQHFEDDALCWECLADAYKARGSFESAIIAYQKTLEFRCPAALTDAKFSAADLPTEFRSAVLYAMYQIAAVQLIVKHYSEAVIVFKRLLLYEADYIPALVGLGSAFVCLGRMYERQMRFGSMIEALAEAVSVSAKVTLLRPDLILSWNNLGDALTMIKILPDDKLVKLSHTKDHLLTEASRNSPLTGIYGLKHTLLSIGGQCYMKAIQLAPRLASLWHDLALNLFHQSQHLATMQEKDMSVSIDELVQDDKVKREVTNLHLIRSPVDLAFVLNRKALEVCKRAVRLAPSASNFWSSLGAIAVFASLSHAALAQHCFIRALQLNAHNAVAWTNLGLLYLKHDSTLLAHRCFKMAQSSDPDYVNAWAAQALIAESLADHEHEAMDLFRHACQLGVQPQAMSAYAFHVLRTMCDASVDRSSMIYKYSITEMHAVPLAHDFMVKYVDLHPHDVWGWNVLALFEEADGLLKSASSSYEKALALNASSQNVNAAFSEQIRWNVCRIYGKTHNLTKMRTLAGKIDRQNLKVNCLLAFSYYRFGELEKAIELLQSCFYYTETDAQKQEVCAALQLIACCLTAQSSLPQLNELLESDRVGCLLAGFLVSFLSPAAQTHPPLIALKKCVCAIPDDKDHCYYWLSLLVELLCSVKADWKQRFACWLVHRYPFFGASWFLLARTFAADNGDTYGSLAGDSFDIAARLGPTNLSKRNFLMKSAYSNKDKKSLANIVANLSHSYLFFG